MLHVCACECTPVTVRVWSSEDNFRGSVPSFHHAGLGVWAVRLQLHRSTHGKDRQLAARFWTWEICSTSGFSPYLLSYCLCFWHFVSKSLVTTAHFVVFFLSLNPSPVFSILLLLLWWFSSPTPHLSLLTTHFSSASHLQTVWHIGWGCFSGFSVILSSPIALWLFPNLLSCSSFSLLSPFTASHTYICVGLSTWD